MCHFAEFRVSPLRSFPSLRSRPLYSSRPTARSWAQFRCCPSTTAAIAMRPTTVTTLTTVTSRLFKLDAKGLPTCILCLLDLSPVQEGEREYELTPQDKPKSSEVDDEVATPTVRSLPENASAPMVPPSKPLVVRGRHLSKPVHKSASASMLTLLIPPTG